MARFESFQSFYDRQEMKAMNNDFDPLHFEIDDDLQIDIEKLEIKDGFCLEGGFSTVYRGRYNNQDDVAIKWTANDDTDKRETIEQQFQREIKIISQMNHQNVVQFVGALVRRAGCAIIMEFVGTKTLAEHLDRKRKKRHSVDLMQSVNFALDVATALDYVHGQSIIHGDLKTANLVLSSDGTRLKLIDFGNAEQTYENFHMIAFHNGSYHFSAPELFNRDEGRSYNEKIDVYSFSIILWELLSHKEAFADMGFEDTVETVLQGERPSLSDIPNGITSLLNDCWADDPSTRPDFAEIKGRLLTFRDSI